MRTRNRRTLAAAVAVAALVAVPAVANADGDDDRSSGRHEADDRRGDDLDAVGLAAKGTQLVRFSTDDPDDARKVGTVRGLGGDTFLVGIDYRVQDGKLYGLGNAGGIYTLSDRNARAQKVGQLTVALSGTAFGVDFNPAADALRVVSDTGQNLRHPFAGATAGQTVTDAPLTYPAVPPATAPTPATGVSAAAYTNNDLDATTATTLFDLNTVLDQVALQAPANAGTLSPTGLLGVDAAVDAGFDVYSFLRGGRTVAVDGYATLTVGGVSALYEVGLLTGQATKVGTFDSAVTDIAIPLGQR
jgi:hypothetical protein